MKVIRSLTELREVRAGLAGPVGLVPTMGYLHEGHLSLVHRAKEECGSVIVTIFVNPTQFGPKEDLSSYPRDEQRDLEMLEREKADVVFLPAVEEVYPPDFGSWVEVSGLTDKLEGASRPTHFRGVTTVVAKLFHMTQPDKAYFGQKDAQQLLVIKKMVADLNMNIEIVTCPTVRANDGLAMSSRNTYLRGEERKAATILHKALMLAEHMWAGGETDARRIRKAMIQLIEAEPLAEIDYVSIADVSTLDEVVDEITPPALVSLAVKIGKPRLIDNTILG